MGVTAIAEDRMDVLELLRKEAPDADLDFLDEGLRVWMQAVMKAIGCHAQDHPEAKALQRHEAL